MAYIFAKDKHITHVDVERRKECRIGSYRSKDEKM